MVVTGSYTSKRTGLTFDIEYQALSDFESIRHMPIGAIGAFCICEEKLVLVYAHKRDSWEIPGGGKEEGETFEECIKREIKEESNMKVIDLIPLGLDTYTNRETGEKSYVLRYAARVEPNGVFTGDGAEDGEITEIKLIDPAEYKNYFDWGERGDVMMKQTLDCLKIIQSQ